jgi:type II secretory pathway pseudopilin PulG
MNTKGFTLIELLAIIIILVILVSMASISVDKIIKSSKSSLSKTQIDIVEKAANIYYLKEGINNSYDNRFFKMCVNLDYLIDNDYIEDDELLNLKDNEKLNGSVEITYESEQFDYKYRENSCTYSYKGINGICEAVTKKTKTTGNIPTGNYIPGDEYICEVKNNTKYHFFVLSTDKDNVNLIMDRNIYYDETNNIEKIVTESTQGLVTWGEGDNYTPSIAMTYLDNATKTWENITNLNMSYDDEMGMFTDFSITGKARLPRYDEVSGEGKCTTTPGSCPLWLVNFLDSSGISELYGYWILSSDGGESYGGGGVFSHRVVGTYDSNFLGVRPVISIEKIDMVN